MEESLLNGFAFTFFRRLEDGTWVLADFRSRGHVLPTQEFGLKLRRRMLAAWGAFVAIAAGVSVASGDPFDGIYVLAAAPALLGGAVSFAASRLPRSRYRFPRRETLFQLRGFVGLLDALLLVWSAVCVGLSFMLSEPFLLPIGALLALVAGLLALGLWHFVAAHRPV